MTSPRLAQGNKGQALLEGLLTFLLLFGVFFSIESFLLKRLRHEALELSLYRLIRSRLSIHHHPPLHETLKLFGKTAHLTIWFSKEGIKGRGTWQDQAHSQIEMFHAH